MPKGLGGFCWEVSDSELPGTAENIRRTVAKAESCHTGQIVYYNVSSHLCSHFYF